MSEREKILIVAPAWVGDAVMSLALIHRLKRQNPFAEISILVVPWCQAVFSLCREVKHVIPLDIPHGVLGIKERWQCAKTLKSFQFDVAYVLPNSWKSALIPFLARIPQRIGFLGEMRWGLLTHCLHQASHLPLLVDKYQFLAGEGGEYLYPQLSIDPFHFNMNILLERGGVSLDKPIMALCPGAEYGPAKRWPSSSYAKVAHYYLNQGWQIWVFGSFKDADIATEISQTFSKNIKNWVGQTSLEEAIYLLNLARMVVTNDSGLMHVAAALNLPTIALFGSSSPSYTPPLSDRSSILYLNVECSPCFKRECPLPADQSLKCLAGIKPQQVIKEISKKLKEESIDLLRDILV